MSFTKGDLVRVTLPTGETGGPYVYHDLTIVDDIAGVVDRDGKHRLVRHANLSPWESPEPHGWTEVETSLA